MMAAMMTAAWRIGRLMAVVAVVSGAPAHMVHDHMSDESTLGARILAASEGLRFQKTRIPEDAEYEQKYVTWNPSRGSASKGGGDVCEQDWGECVHGLGCYSSCYDGSGSVCCSKHGVKSDGLCKYDHDCAHGYECSPSDCNRTRYPASMVADIECWQKCKKMGESERELERVREILREPAAPVRARS